MDFVSLVLISHSEEIVVGLKKLINQVQPNVAIAIAGGVDGEIGTNVFHIKEAIESVHSEKGTVVFFDLGSALLNAEMAIEMVEGNENIRIADAPLLEGAYFAAVEAGFGHSLREVVASGEAAKSFQKVPDL
ncbi:dihydroxyacetone kinase phosphoryl donor subunit DhaM [Caldibacillus lycopersici]|uniref:phosphoenolpyruvate--glycerone phosphotransferase n=1 Tax=Perspicuibacillus lycopersici TaxID=1325689 RepID=A0AAE3LLS5_9BACI|nr:dihydroxyacetone kinase phosphoryl donor subunit DhaM [Perspicuibacillus lycopersici]MCU9612700.1 dihydroxyacetone kinase phosphoryl donor subunit DhaM [Perspicuibacillus lycopersici]